MRTTPANRLLLSRPFTCMFLNCALPLHLQREIDVFNALDLMENDPAVLKELKFGPGDGHLQYYLYNWACPEMPPKGNGLVLL